ncbi:Acetyltransferase (GNAT) family protein [Desemzia incerta]|uniref:Acetyltransferase (GNAT) family protein n=1 Tax=Desemzia incerta TaxID=82801 RepID=A0A1I5X4A2_9LACT|nr:GNAT family N-acetyltransferase [Desemzia incerta]SFQ26780.1 Acetyltransferase (GNAT) family protein [Desemzia incerta]
MLDKSIPYAEIWMYRERELPVVEKTLPEGFRFELYQEGDELEWAAIETAVAEFDDETKAIAYFNEKFAPYPKELKQRMFFVTDPAGEKVGTCSAWWKKTPDGTRYPLVHWVAVKPGYQGKGLAKAMMTQTLKLLQNLETTSPIYLHTQTWSHPAIRLYQTLGFEITDKNLDGSPNPEYDKAIAILAELEKST